MAASRPIDCDNAWREVADQWQFPAGVTYLNHGSFGPSPVPVRSARNRWQSQLDRQPMDFFVRTLEPALRDARDQLSRFVQTASGNLVFMENATAAMNVVAASFDLQAGDEVLLNDHEYGAVQRIWQRACEKSDARLVIAHLPDHFSAPEEIVDAVVQATTDKTRLIVCSHITSPTAVMMPVGALCAAARAREIAICLDGPHAPAHVDLRLDQLPCDFYTASCHKWLSAPFGTGFLYVHPRWQHAVRPVMQSWGRLLPNRPTSWDEEFIWSGTRDPSGYLAVPAAIEFLADVGLQEFRERTHFLARAARHRLSELWRQPDMVPDSADWYGSMAQVRLPPGDGSKLQLQLWEQYGIEVPVVPFADRWHIRISCHLYTMMSDVQRLVNAVSEL